MITHIYQSANHPTWYLVLPEDLKDDFSGVPDNVITQLGALQKIESSNEGPGSLGIDLLQVRDDFDTQNYHIAKPVE
ncbi:YcgL domain-containing protein [Larkinella rosea]|uniref:Uncharacterized protein n=1 Tax=Larkinella rosea TaxID=2025312 RepID=A0A3P1BLZ4_9BACT|nr:YcgL domain-containing protein [Larkinella rosea]RRB02038.1 hypothetical protein EHT25_16220 [Larkinella rosea]